jgi:hypothetical protein
MIFVETQAQQDAPIQDPYIHLNILKGWDICPFSLPGSKHTILASWGLKAISADHSDRAGSESQGVHARRNPETRRSNPTGGIMSALFRYLCCPVCVANLDRLTTGSRSPTDCLYDSSFQN